MITDGHRCVDIEPTTYNLPLVGEVVEGRLAETAFDALLIGERGRSPLDFPRRRGELADDVKWIAVWLHLRVQVELQPGQGKTGSRKGRQRECLALVLERPAEVARFGICGGQRADGPFILPRRELAGLGGMLDRVLPIAQLIRPRRK